MDSGEWAVVFVTEASERSPVREFLDRLDLKAQARLRRAIEHLVQRNVRAAEPLVRHLEGKLWELRVESDTNTYRLVDVFDTGRRVVFLHGFQKKTQKTPRRELDVATKRLEDFQAMKEA